MLRETYERMLKKFGPDAPGTIQAKRQLDEEIAVNQGRQAMEDDRRSRKVIIQLIPKAPQTKSSSKPPETPPETPTS